MVYLQEQKLYTLSALRQAGNKAAAATSDSIPGLLKTSWVPIRCAASNKCMSVYEPKFCARLATEGTDTLDVKGSLSTVTAPIRYYNITL